MAASSSPQVQQWLQEGIAAAKRGDKARARELLVQVTEVDDYNEQAWLWLSGVVESDEEREICLENVLTINPQNAFAQRGLALLRQQPTATPPPPEPLPRPEEPSPPPFFKPRSATPPSPVVEPKLEEAGGFLSTRSAEEPKGATTRKWGDRPGFRLESVTGKRELPPEPTDEDILEGRVAAVTETVTAKEAEKKPKKRRRKKRRRKPWALPRWLKRVFAALVLVGAIVGGMASLKLGPFTPEGRGYASLMRPLLDEYDAWLSGPYKNLDNMLRAPCGPEAFSYWPEGQAWTIYDALIICSHQPATDCAALQTFCGGDLETMLGQIDQSAQKTLDEIESLLASIDEIEQPEDIPQAHTFLLMCVEERITELKQVRAMARGEVVGWLGQSAVCHMFPDAEQQLRQYLDNQ